ncbi:unnamed protein product [Adineta ricciae]|uniref:Uncharacterized protein n=1 Tax=Adineta ricciae TaxID=249248 RepID=A0A814JEW3_ADIRI|nr:unnamed protein product [Adineta ricciae]CAF1036649.1 unnamed protein product [Adineta ricciae]
MTLFSIFIVVFACIHIEVYGARWTTEQANAWYAEQPWYFGANFVPSTSVNEIDMWQAFDTATMERELGWATNINMNIMRVFLHVLFYQENPEAFYKKMDAFLTIADRHHIKIVFVLFDECWRADPALGPQPDPIPGQHNSQWVRCPGQAWLLDQSKWPLLKKYTVDVLTRFSNDARVAFWDLYNEPQCSQQVPIVLPLLHEVYAAALEANPRQPLTFGILPEPLNVSLSVFELESSDIITFHSYEPLSGTINQVAQLRQFNRPLICTEYMARSAGSTFHTHTRFFRQEKIGAINWGLVAGKTQTYFPWGSPVNASTPLVWFHDVFNASGVPYSTISRVSMANRNKKPCCLNCGKERAISKCTGCSKDYCYYHLTVHRRELNRQLDHIERNRDIFKQNLNEQIRRYNQDYLMRQINQWEQESIKTIQKTANECREVLMHHRQQYYENIKGDLENFTEQVKEIREENDFNEVEVNKFKEKFKQIQQQLRQPMNLTLHRECIPLVHKISIIISSGQFISPDNIDNHTKWKSYGSTIAGGNGGDNQMNQLYFPQGICIDTDNDHLVYIADYENHRVVEWKYGKTNGRIVAGGMGQGCRIDQLNSPTDVIIDKRTDSLIICDAGNRRIVQWSRLNMTYLQTLVHDIDCIGLTMDKHGDLYVSDHVKNEVRRWKHGEICGKIVAGGNGRGDELNQLSCATHIFVDDDYSVYVSDCNNNRVMKWIKDAREGIIVAGGNGPGNKLNQLSLPQGIFVDHLGNLYVADSLNHRIMRWLKNAQEGCVIVGGNGEGDEMNQFNCTVSLAFDQRGNLYVVDYNNHRVQKFDIDLN